jgi:lipopolysaccharide transport system permease protein
VSNLIAPGDEVKFFSFTEISRSFNLLVQLVKRDISIRFTGSALGLGWAVLQPLSLVALYWFVFTQIIVIPRGPGSGEIYYPLFLVSGLLPWLGFTEGLTRSASSIVENAAVVRRLSFRSEVLVVVPHLTAMVFQLIGLAIFSIALIYRGPDFSALWILPFALLVQLLLQIGLGWIVATLFVFFRDVGQILGFSLSFIFFLSPIIYSVAGDFEHILRWNPLTPLLGLFRSAFLGAAIPPAGSIVFLMVVTSILFTFGLWFFRKAQGTMVDLI